MSAPTLRQAIAWAVPQLEAAGVEGARRDAEVLLCLALECDRTHVIGYPDRIVDAVRMEEFERLVTRRAAREPVSQIAGRREFWSLEFEVTRATLTPRPESELVVEAVLNLMGDRTAPLRLLDLGTGTGCLLLALLAELPMATGLGVDLCAGALEVARANARRLGFDARAAFVRGDWATALGASFDVVVSNPPYVGTAELMALDPEVARWEPNLALHGGNDGLDAYRTILPDLARLLTAAGVAVLEHGEGQADEIENLARACGLAPAIRRQDLAGCDRCLILRR